ncbi:hypothetical protein QUB80_22805 [Chlorogloeopsis sp. ULAP01]|jgi:hypothetical protein|uniref:hypothetical protein n=1 Tax=Chlorogloeopsis sp. ULAP01 TaxID=3056483 RepID=UPI0025AAD28F|nr:hypothetical protein [Chlorogloeopsis sp. ULAP01]MDM9383521.1 hypothetical protein [Chlorogloeopsis sp. ULAP01]
MTVGKLKLKPGQEVNANKSDKRVKRSDSEISVTTTCNSSEQESVEHEPKPREEFATESELPTADTVVVAVEVLEELTEEEKADRHRLELKIERAFYEAGCALRELRERRLYRSTHRTFEEYCRDRFNYSRDTAYLKIAAAVVYDNIQKFLPTIGRQTPMPTNERQLRDLAKANFEPELQAAAWLQGVEEAGGKVPSGRIIKGIVEQLKEKPLLLASDFCQIGEVFTLTRLEGTERKYNGCWAIAVALKEFSVEVDVHDTTLNVKPENLNKIDSPEVHRQLPQIKKRIKRLRDYGILDRCAYTVLESLGRQTYLTPVEEGLLEWLEKYYGVDS